MAAPRKLLASVSPATLGLAAAAGAGVVAFNMSKSSAEPATLQKNLGQRPVFPAMGFVSLTLEEARMINHDTRELKFKLPDNEATSGLSPVCECPVSDNRLEAHELTLYSVASHTSHSRWILVSYTTSLHTNQHSG
jgi:hypothetical protein